MNANDKLWGMPPTSQAFASCHDVYVTLHVGACVFAVCVQLGTLGTLTLQQIGDGLSKEEVITIKVGTPAAPYMQLRDCFPGYHASVKGCRRCSVSRPVCQRFFRCSLTNP
jgi:hypothetical protein